MARGLLAQQEVPAHGAMKTPTFTAIVAGNDAYFENDGRVILLFRNSNEAASAACTLKGAQCSHGLTSDVTITVPQATATEDGLCAAGPFPLDEFNQTGSSDLGHVHIDTEVETISVAPLHFVPAN